MKKVKKKPRVNSGARRGRRAPEKRNEDMVPPVQDRGAAALQIRGILDRLFDGNAEEIVKSLADSGELTAEEMARMKEVFTKRKGGRKR